MTTGSEVDAARREDARQLLANVTLPTIGEHTYETVAQSTFGPRLFGGHVVAIAVAAVMRDAGSAQAPNSLHAYFLRPVLPDVPMRLQVEPLHAGRSFQTYVVRLVQEQQVRLAMTCQFHADEPGVDYQPQMPDVPGPDGLDEPWPNGPIECRSLGPTPQRDDGSYASTGRFWLRFVDELPDDPVVDAALAAYVSDLTGNSFRPLSLDRWDGFADASLDHTVWFHRPFRLDEWVFYDTHCVINHGGRSLVRGALYDATGQLCMSMAQEILIRPLTG